MNKSELLKVRVDPELKARVDRLAAYFGQPYAELVRRYVREGLNREEHNRAFASDAIDAAPPLADYEPHIPANLPIVPPSPVVPPAVGQPARPAGRCEHNMPRYAYCARCRADG